MEFEFLQRVKRTSVITGLILFPVWAAYLNMNTALGWLFGGAWSLINIFAIKRLVVLTCQDNVKRLHVYISAFAKVPVLYAAGFFLLKSGLPIPALLAGFMWPLSIVVLKASGRMILRMDQSPVFEKSLRAGNEKGRPR